MGGAPPERWGGDNPQLSTRYRNVPPWNVPGELGRAECGERQRRSLRSLGGGLRSWLAVRWTSTAALNLTAPPLLRLAAPATGGPRRCGGVDEAACGARKKSRRAEPAASGRTVASVAEGTPPRARGPGIRHSQLGARPLRLVPGAL